MDRHYDVALLVPLEEEFDYLKEILPVRESFQVLGDYYYEVDVEGSDSTIVAHIIGDMGQGHASLAAERMAERFSPNAVVLIGLAGSLKSDILLGDVVIATQVDAYLQGAKAVPGRGEDTFEFESAGEVWRSPFSLLQFTRNFRHMPELGDLYSAWRDDAAARRKQIDVPADTGLARTEPALVHGPMASGDVVAAAQAFSRWLHHRNRKLAAVEMEAGGVANAAQSRGAPIDLLVIRGVSDFADERKADLDALDGGTSEPGVWRRYAVHNAAGLVQAFLRSGHFPPHGEIEARPRKAGRSQRGKGQSSAKDPPGEKARSPFVGKGHKRALADLLAWLEQPDPIRLLQGFSGIGKSRLAHELSARAPRGWQTVWVDDTPADSVQALLLDIAGELDRKNLARALPGGDLMLVLEQALATKVIVVLDEFQKMLPPRDTGATNAGIANLIQRAARRRGKGKILLISNQAYPDWLSQYPLQSLPPLDGAEGTAFVKGLLAARGCVEEADDARLGEVVGFLGGNPRALEVLSAFLVSDPLDSLVGPQPYAWEIADRQVDPALVERLEERIVRRIVSRVDDGSRELMKMLSVYRRPVELDAIAAFPMQAPAAALARRELIASFLLEQRRSGWYALHPIAQQIAIEHLSQNPRELRAVHALAANYYARHFRAKQVRASQHGRNFLDARYHMMKSGNQSELRVITSKYVLYLERAYSQASVPSDPEELGERIAVLIAAHESAFSPELSYHLARLLFARAHEGDTELALEHLRDAAPHLSGHEAWSLLLRINQSLSRHDAIAPTFRTGFAQVRDQEAKSHLYHLALDLMTRVYGLAAACDLAQEFIGQFEVGPELPVAYLRLSQDLARSGRLTEAVTVAQEAVTRLGVTHGSLRVHINAIELLIQTGDVPTAAQLWDEAAEKFPEQTDDNFAFVRLGILERAGQIDDAVALARKKVATQDMSAPGSRWFKRLLQLLIGQGDVAGVKAVMQHVLERCDEAADRVAAGRQVMNILTAAGAEEDALAVGHLLIEVVEPHGALVAVYRDLMQLYLRMDNPAQAIVLGYESLSCFSPNYDKNTQIYGETMRLLVGAGFLEEALALGELIEGLLPSSPELGHMYHIRMEILALSGAETAARNLGWRATSTLNAEHAKDAVYRDLLYLLAHEKDADALQECEDEAFATLPPGEPMIVLCTSLARIAIALRGRRAGLEKILHCCRRISADDAAEVLPNAFYIASVLGEWDVIDHIDEIASDKVPAKRLKMLAAIIRAQSTADYSGALRLIAEARNDGFDDHRIMAQEIFALCCAGRAQTATELYDPYMSPDVKISAGRRTSIWLSAFAHHLAGAHEASNRYAIRYLERELTPEEMADRDLVFDLWCASAGQAGPTPSYFFPRLPRTVTGLTYDLAVPANLALSLEWPYPVANVKRTDLIQQKL
jgi:nucleoside phosphorylase/tetratricopeptide (TPR) repeat protein